MLGGVIGGPRPRYNASASCLRPHQRVEEITAGAPFREAACGVVSTLKCIVIEMGWQIKRIAVSHLTRRFRRRCPTGFAHEASLAPPIYA